MERVCVVGSGTWGIALARPGGLAKDNEVEVSENEKKSAVGP